MDLDIKGLRVLVTAGAGGIGLAIARRFAGEGAKVHTCDVDEMALAALAANDPAITATPCDVSDRAAVKRLFDDALAKLGGLDVLVNNAGIAGPTAKVDEMNPEDWDRCLEICLTGQFNCTRLAVPHLRQSRNASIVNLSSAAGRLGFAMRTPYAAAKWGVEGFSEVLSKEVGPLGVKVTIIEPGGFRTDFAGSSTSIREGRPEYDATVGKTARFQRDFNGKQPGDPAKAAAAVLRITGIDNPPLRLILGSDAFQAIEQNDLAKLNFDRQWKDLSISTDFVLE